MRKPPGGAGAENQRCTVANGMGRMKCPKGTGEPRVRSLGTTATGDAALASDGKPCPGELTGSCGGGRIPVPVTGIGEVTAREPLHEAVVPATGLRISGAVSTAASSCPWRWCRFRRCWLWSALMRRLPRCPSGPPLRLSGARSTAREALSRSAVAVTVQGAVLRRLVSAQVLRRVTLTVPRVAPLLLSPPARAASADTEFRLAAAGILARHRVSEIVEGCCIGVLSHDWMVVTNTL